MSEQKASKNKIGARCLSDLEAELILPNYKRIYHQIEQFRMEKESINRSKKQKTEAPDEDPGSRNQDQTQKTNNIGIIGVRGAGKTSVLKTIRVRLEKENYDKKRNDIILPIVVPENMSESGALMATILGMLNDVIRKRDEEEQKKQKRSNPDCIRKTDLRIKYDEVVKQYTYIQKEYRSILISQYTTENDYVKRSASVFNSDTEFISKFNELVEELVGAQSSSLLFLFIDDIDLSTYRCADVVRTLLSYLSNENIVTFISGDLETFEEALTLDFLRQENVLTKDILNEKVGDNTLLAGKKLLAYEYLKKIIPPVYRYNIKHWSLEEKGNYCIEDSGENHAGGYSPAENQIAGRQKASITLSDLLFQALEGWVNPAFFRYAEIEDGKEDQNQEERGNQEKNTAKGVLPYTYHLFDNTSRGLNNIYNVLNEIIIMRKESEKEKKEEDFLKEKKLLLDTIISSKPIYNRYRNDIQQSIFHVGATKADSRVFFDNARATIYKKDITEPEKDAQQNQKNPLRKYHITDPVERFSLFILTDFAARLLYEGDYEKKTIEEAFYKILKEEAIKDFFFNPIIAEKVMEVSHYSWESEKEKESRKIALKKGDKEYPALKDMKLKDVNSSFLLKGDLVLNLAYYKNLPLDEVLKLYEDKTSEESNQESLDSAELKQSSVIAIWRAFSSVSRVNADENVSNIIARYYSVFWKEFAYIRNQLSSSVTQNIAIRLFDDELNAVVEGNKKKTGPPNAETWEDRRKKAQMRRILSNTLAQALKAEDEDEIKENWQEIQFDNLYVIEKEEKRIEEKDIERENVEKRVKILKTIESDGLWQEEAAGDVADYLRITIRGYLRFIKNALENKEGWRLNTGDADNNWQVFLETYVGVSATVARRTRNSVKRILEENQADFEHGMPLETYRKVIEELEELAGNNRVWYGQSEAQHILNDLQKASAEPNGQGRTWDTWIGKHSYFIFLLQCLYKYRMEAAQDKNIMRNALLLADITKKLSAAHKEADRQTLDNFIGKLNKNLEDKIDSESFDKLFSLYPTDK